MRVCKGIKNSCLKKHINLHYHLILVHWILFSFYWTCCYLQLLIDHILQIVGSTSLWTFSKLNFINDTDFHFTCENQYFSGDFTGLPKRRSNKLFPSYGLWQWWNHSSSISTEVSLHHLIFVVCATKSNQEYNWKIVTIKVNSEVSEPYSPLFTFRFTGSFHQYPLKLKLQMNPHFQVNFCFSDMRCLR